MKKILTLLFLIAIISNTAFSQKAKSVFFELLGPGLASVNYDSRFNKTQDGLGFRVGIGGWSEDNGSVTTFPLGLNYLLGGDGKNYFEVGGNITFVSVQNTTSSNSDKFTGTFGTLNFGYRSQPKNKGFSFRAAMNPIITHSNIFPIYIGLSFGYKF